jgi:hypothetical protein
LQTETGLAYGDDFVARKDMDGFVWFDGVTVVAGDIAPQCLVGEKLVPLPVAILHPDCLLASPGDVGALGVPFNWAVERGLIEGLRP